jgi:ATP-dependent helicase/nuclease subunit A
VSAPGPDAPLADAAERRRALEDLDTTLLVEAAAGSGKTTLLLGRIVNLVRSGRARLREIAAITFTEAAAAELRVKLRRELERAGLREALGDLEAARIGTIHAFCASLLRERPVEAGVDPGFTITDPLGADLLFDATWESWLPEALATPEAAEPVQRAIGLGVPLERLRALARALVEERDRLDRLPSEATRPEPLDALARDLRAAVARLEGVVRDGARDPDDRAAAAVAALAAWVRQTAGLGDEAQGRALLEDAPLPERVERLGNRARWRDAAGLADVRGTLADLHRRAAAAAAVVRHDLVVVLGRWARGFVDAYQARKARAGRLDFQDLLVRARDLVRDRPDVRADFQRRIRYLLVDEFQDTDPLQLELVLALTAGAPPGSLFIVGDPKQSIYRFRRADIETYEAAKAEVARRGAVLAVRVSFRSDRTVLDAVNRVFEGVMAPPPDGAYQPAYVPLAPAPGAAAGVPPTVLEVTADGPPGSAEAAALQEARGLARWLLDEARAGRVRFGDVALLFRAMTAAGQYEDAFREAGVPFRTVGSRHYYDRSEVGWTVAALAAIEDPHDAVALVGALRSPYFGVTDDALAALRALGGRLTYATDLPAGADPALAAAWALLRELHGARNAVAPPALVERLLVRTQVLAAYGLDPHGEARLANLLKVLDTARALEGSGVATFRALVRWLRDRGAARYEEEESLVEGEDAVRLMTIHKAKGLEFPVVVVPDLARAAPAREPVLLGDRASGRLGVRLARGRGVPALATLDWEELVEREGRRADAEALRLLYVALTRARQRLVLPLPPRPEPGGFLDHLVPLLDGAVERVVVAVDGAPRGAAGPPAGEPGVAGESLDAWRARRAALLATGARADPAIAGGEPAPPPVTDPTRARVARLVRATLAVADLACAAEAEALVAALGARHRLPADAVATARRGVATALAAPVLARAREAAWRLRDVPVAAEIDGVAVDERADLVFEEGGALVLVAWAAGDEPPDAAARRARLAAALGRALGRPVRETVVVPAAF